MIPFRLYLYGAAAAIVFGAVLAFSHSRYAAGEAAANAHWEKQVATERAESLKLLDAETARVNKEHNDAVESLANLSTNYERRIADDKILADKRVADLRSGAERLRVAINPGTCRDGTAGHSAASASGSDGSATGELLPAVAGNLEQFARDADAIVVQLGLAQDTVEQYYKTCGPRPAQ